MEFMLLSPSSHRCPFGMRKWFPFSLPAPPLEPRRAARSSGTVTTSPSTARMRLHTVWFWFVGDLAMTTSPRAYRWRCRKALHDHHVARVVEGRLHRRPDACRHVDAVLVDHVQQAPELHQRLDALHRLAPSRFMIAIMRRHDDDDMVISCANCSSMWLSGAPPTTGASSSLYAPIGCLALLVLAEPCFC